MDQISSHEFQRYFVKYLNTYPLSNPVCGTIRDAVDIVDLLGLMEDALDGMVFGDNRAKYSFSHVAKQGRVVTVHGENSTAYAVATAEPIRAQIVINPNPDLSYLLVDGDWRVHIRNEDPQNNVCLKDEEKPFLIFRPETGCPIEKQSAMQRQNVAREDVYEFLWSRFEDVVLKGLTPLEVNRYMHVRMLDKLRFSARKDRFMKQISDEFPIIAFTLFHNLGSKSELERYVEYLAGRAFAMPHYVKTLRYPDRQECSIMLEIP